MRLENKRYVRVGSLDVCCELDEGIVYCFGVVFADYQDVTKRPGPFQ